MGFSKEDTTIEIKRNKTKTGLLSFAALAFAVLFILMWLRVYYQNIYPPEELQFISVYLTPILLIVGIFGLKKTFDTAPAFVISSVGISNNANIVTFDLIKWKEITKFETTSVKSTKMIIVHVINPEQFIKEATGIKTIFMKMGNWFYGTPFSITPNVLDCSFNDLVETLNYKLTKYNPQ